MLAARPASLDPVHDGTLDGLRRTMDAAGIGHAMVLGVANVARTVERTNELIGSVDRSRFTPFGTVHPDLPPEVNLRSLLDNGIRGVKLHPLFQDLSLADPRVIEILHALAGAGHHGDHARRRGRRRARPTTAARPATLRAALDAVPDADADRLPLRRLPPAGRGRASSSSAPGPSWRRPGRRGWRTWTGSGCGR